MSDNLVVLARCGAVLVTLWVLQAAVFSLHVVADVKVNLLLSAAVAAGLAGGASRGALGGFASGLALDLLLITPFGLGALTGTLVGYVSGAMGDLRLRQSALFPVAVGLVLGAASVVIFATAGELLGQRYLANPDLWPMVMVQAGATAVLALPLGAVWTWAWRPPAQSRMVMA